MMDDDEDFDDTQYYEEPREVIASRTGTSLPSYADDTRDQLHSHHSTYSMHEAKHMKHKIPSYDLFANSKSHRDDDEEEEEEENDDGMTISEMYDDEEDGRKHKRKSDSDESIERAPSSHHRSHADRGDESLPTLADSMEADADDESSKGSSKHHKHKHSKKSDADEDDVPPWTAFANGDFS